MKRREKIRRIRKLGMEQLEFRALLTTGLQTDDCEISIANLVTQEETFVVNGLARPGIGPQVSQILDQIAAEKSAGAFRGDAKAIARALGVDDDAVRVKPAGEIYVEVTYNPGDNTVAETLKSRGVNVGRSFAKDGILEAWIKKSDLDAFAGLQNVLVRLPLRPQLRVGAYTTQGDSILLAPDVRSRFANQGVDGSGVKIGVISDGVDHLSTAQSSNDLPAGVTVNPSLDGSGDEGTAMLEIIHDLAPGASLYFSSGIGGTVDMVASIQYMLDQQVDVIVDDLGFYGEPYFLDGSVAQKAAQAVAQGRQYVSAAGNDNKVHFQAMSNIVSGSNNRTDFNPNAGFDDTLNFSVPNGGSFTAILQWSEGWGTASTNFNLQLWRQSDGQLKTQSTTVQDGNPLNGADYPYEQIWWTSGAGSTQTFQLRVTGPVGAIRELEIFILPFNYSSVTFPITETYLPSVQYDALFGHTAVDGVISVGAIAASDPGNDLIEVYSSVGPSTIYTNPATQTKTIRYSMDVAGIDGVDTLASRSGWAPFAFNSQFFGTSAAAPHVAAIVGLMKDAAAQNPGSLNMGTVLHATAVDLGTAGYDNYYGSGRPNALEAVYQAFTPVQAPNLDAASDNGYSSTDDITSLTTLTFTGSAPLGSTVGLFDNGSGPIATATVDGSGNYSITGAVAANLGHNMTVKVKSSPSATVYSQPSPPLTVWVDQLADPGFVQAKPTMAAGSDTGASNSDGYTTVTNPNFTGTALFPNGSPAGSAFVQVYLDGVFQFTVQAAAGTGAYSFNLGTLSYGFHNVTVRTKMIAGLPDAAYNMSNLLKIYIDNGAAPIVSITQVSTPRTTNVGSIAINFDRPVGGFSLSSLNLTTNAGSNRIPLGSAVFLDTIDSAAWALASIGDITMSQGNYNLQLSNTGITSLAAGTALASGTSMQWIQARGSVPYRTGATTNASTTLSSLSITTGDLRVGMSVTGAGIPDGTTVASIVDSTTVTISSAATLTRSGGLFVFTVLPRTGNTTSASTTISNLSATSDLVVGMPVSGTGIPGGATIASIVNSTSITISSAATSTNTGVYVVFGPAGFQNVNRYLDVDNDGFVAPNDALFIINFLNSVGSGPVPVAGCASGATCGYLDVNNDNFVVPGDALEVINYLNGPYDDTPVGMSMVGGGGGATTPPADLTADQVTANVQLQVTDLNGAPITSARVGDQFRLQALLVLTAPAGVEAFAGYADATYPVSLVSPSDNSADLGQVGSTVSGGVVDEAGRVVYGDSSTVLFTKTFTAKKKGTATFAADAADLLSHEIYVTGLSEALPWSQVTFSSTTLRIR